MALTSEKSNFDGFDISIGSSKVNLESSNSLSLTVSALDISGNYFNCDPSGNNLISFGARSLNLPTPQRCGETVTTTSGVNSFDNDKQIFNIGVSYTHPINVDFNIGYSIEFSPSTINLSSGVNSFTQTDEASNLLRSSLQLGYLVNPELQIGLKAGLAQIDSKKRYESSIKEEKINGKSIGITAKKKIKDNVFLNFEYSQISFDGSQINDTWSTVVGQDSATATYTYDVDYDLDIELFAISLSYKF
jgi:hypothetical protein